MSNSSKEMPVNSIVQAMGIYASKAISNKAKEDPSIADLSFGEPVFGPPDYSIDEIKNRNLSYETFLDSAKRYEGSQGSLELRQAVSDWYRQRYELEVDPHTEIMITHGGVEAITLAMLAVTGQGDTIALADPSYMLYSRTIQLLSRQAAQVSRAAGGNEVANLLATQSIEKAKAFIINSPENPSGYVLSAEDWKALAKFSNLNKTWIIHDEVYDTMTSGRAHTPAFGIDGLRDNTITINSFSKKFGLPGLRIGWMVAPRAVIELAKKIHDYMYLGVNIQYQSIATTLLRHPARDTWLTSSSHMVASRAEISRAKLTSEFGFTWNREPHGAMFLFPNISGLYHSLPSSYKSAGNTEGEAVAAYLLNERKVAVVPGCVYGKEGNNSVRMVLCTADSVFNTALERLTSKPLGI
ncbi:pyridoxal phosphate-dependent aminotransferase [Pseudomonas cichorii]|uniref:pyridoxal phosphate-dependent aminotransferase n=1 Tax=Pseudomonas cichorii TaxID=36746 RepID=UPI0018E5DF40|nr:pyridoxal phosphate-dependent aminotransferase [Pseudomonas cichorii]MBI6853480.1 pyridoxal phosphate-dependent aminotransferase [Pseudomonas cichorii]